jgi:hypothetical protein
VGRVPLLDALDPRADLLVRPDLPVVVRQRSRREVDRWVERTLRRRAVHAEEHP